MFSALDSKRSLARYLVPVAVGMGGILFSQSLDIIAARVLVLMVSLSIPLFAGGFLLARHKTDHVERAILLGAVLLLLLGAVVSVFGIQSVVAGTERVVSDRIERIARDMGLVSLVLGLFAILFSVVRTGEDIEEIGAYFTNLAGHMTEGFLFTDANGVILLVNDTLLDLMHVNREQLLGKKSLDVAHTLRLTEVEEYIRTRDRSQASEYEIGFEVAGEKRRLWFSDTPIFNRQGRFVATLTTVRDVTEYINLKARADRYAERLEELVNAQTRKLMHSEERFRNLLTSMSEGFMTVGPDKKVRFANSRMAELLGMSANELVGRDVFDFVDVISRVHLFSLLAEQETGGAGARCELNLLDHEGKLTPVLAGVSHIYDPYSGTGLHSLVVTSLSDQKALQRELEVRAMELELANEELLMHGRAKDSFLSNVSHELRTPLSTVQGYVELLEGGTLGPLSAAQQGALSVMQRNLVRLIDLITEMIEFSRMEIRGVTLNYALVRPERLLREAAAAIHPHAMRKNITVSMSVPDGLPCVWGDYGKLSQTLGVFCNNAVKFTGEGGAIRLSAEYLGERGLALSVTDTGIGIEAVNRERIFAKFFQVDSSKSRRYEGAGIGLSIAKAIIEAHHGAVTLDSELGKGSTFSAVLPRVFDGRSSRLLDETLRLSIVLVDEDGSLAESLHDLFQSTECQVTAVSNAFEATRLCEHEQPHLIVLDALESGPAGTSPVELLRQHPDAGQIPLIVLVSSGGARSQAVGALWDGVVLLEKPFTPNRFAASVRAACFDEPLPEEIDESKPAQTRQERKHVLLVDSDPGMQEWMEIFCRNRHIPVRCVYSAHQAAALPHDYSPDLVFVDADIAPGHFEDRMGILMDDVRLSRAKIYLMAGKAIPPPPGGNVAGVIKKPFSTHDIEGLLAAPTPPLVAESVAFSI